MQICDFEYEKYNFQTKIVILGFEVYSEIITYCLEQHGIPVTCYISEKYSASKKTVRISELFNEFALDDITILISADVGMLNDTFKQLERFGVNKLYVCHKLLDDTDYLQSEGDEEARRIYLQRHWLRYIPELNLIHPENLYLVSLDATVTTRCTLRCESCSNLMQYYQHPQNMDVDQLIENIDVLLEKADGIGDLRILGGEPFMNPDFIKIIRKYENEKKIGSITIFTNATIFPNESILDLLKNSRAIMMISDYDDLSRKKDQWIKWCRENHVKYMVPHYDEWHDLGQLENHHYTEYQLRDIYRNCDCRSIPTVLNGRLYACPYAANAAQLGAMNEKEAEIDSIEISLFRDKSKQSIDEFLYGRNYLEACRYCKGRNPIKSGVVQKCVQAKKPLAYKEGVIENPVNVEDTPNERVSIIIPIYNKAEYLDCCLKSIKEQSYSNIEVIMVDDGSSDGSGDICEGYADSDDRFVYVKNEHSGVTRTRFKGVSLATGENILFCDADDWIDKDYVSELVNEIGDCDAITGGYIVFDPSVNIPGSLMDRGQNKCRYEPIGIAAGIYEKEKYKLFLCAVFDHSESSPYTIPGYMWGSMWKKELVNKVFAEWGDEEFSIPLCEDLLFSHCYYLHASKVRIIPFTGYYYRLDGNDEHDKDTTRWIKSTIKVFEYLRNKMAESENEKEWMHDLNKEFVFFMGTWLSNFIYENKLFEGPIGYWPYFGRLYNKRVVLYGAGKVGKMFRRYILRDGEARLVAWVDKNFEEYRREQKQVDDISKIKDVSFDYILIGVGEKEMADEIKRELLQFGVDEDKILWNPLTWRL